MSQALHDEAVRERPQEVAHKIDAVPLDYGPSDWVTPAALDTLLHDRALHLSGILKFLEACQRLAEIGSERDPSAGVVLTDPLGLIEVRWNPVARRMTRAAGDGVYKVYANLPTKMPHTKGQVNGRSMPRLRA